MTIDSALSYIRNKQQLQQQQQTLQQQQQQNGLPLDSTSATASNNGRQTIF
jgi:hypothetical protein